MNIIYPKKIRVFLFNANFTFMQILRFFLDVKSK